MRRLKRCLPPLLALLLAACGSAPQQITPRPATTPPKPIVREPGVPLLPPANSGRGAYYQDDGPGDDPPPNLLQTPDAEVRNDPVLPRANRPYTVFGKTYTPMPPGQPFVQRGPGTWYGKKFHGQRTSSGELYDMYKMTAAHPTLPIPSYARVTNLQNGQSVVVRINDRGPFHSTRVIDVSYTAALKLGLLVNGSSQLEVRYLPPDEIEQMLAAQRSGTPMAPPPQAMPKAAPVLVAADGEEQVRAMLLSGQDVPAAGFYLQLGSYGRADGAQALRERLQAADGAMRFEVAQAGKFFRLYAGPYASREAALQAAQALPPALKLKPLVIER